MNPDHLAGTPNAGEASELDALRERLLHASYLIAQSTTHLDRITRTETIKFSEEYAERLGKLSYERRPYNVKDARVDATAAAHYIRQAWDLLDPPQRPWFSLAKPVGPSQSKP